MINESSLNASSISYSHSHTSSTPVRCLDDFELVPVSEANKKGNKSNLNNTPDLGKGAYGVVKLVRDKKTQKLYAMKIVKKSIIIQHRTMEYIKREIKIQKKLKHPHIISLYTYFEDKENVYIVLEYAERGSLFVYLRRKKRLAENEAFIYFLQTCLGIDYLHKHHITHRDLKPENLLIDGNGNIKMTDFGWSAIVDGHNFRNTYCGTIDYMAPEMVSSKPHDEKVDLWSLGVLLYELIHGKPPFPGSSFLEKSMNIIKGGITFDQMVTEPCRDLINGLVRATPNERMPLDQVFKHKFMLTHAKQFGTDIEKYLYKPKPKEKAMILINEKMEAEHNTPELGGKISTNLKSFEKMPISSNIDRSRTPEPKQMDRDVRKNLFETRPEDLKPSRFKTPSPARGMSPNASKNGSFVSKINISGIGESQKDLSGMTTSQVRDKLFEADGKIATRGSNLSNVSGSGKPNGTSTPQRGRDIQKTSMVLDVHGNQGDGRKKSPYQTSLFEGGDGKITTGPSKSRSPSPKPSYTNISVNVPKSGDMNTSSVSNRRDGSRTPGTPRRASIFGEKETKNNELDALGNIDDLLSEFDKPKAAPPQHSARPVQVQNTASTLSKSKERSLAPPYGNLTSNQHQSSSNNRPNVAVAVNESLGGDFLNTSERTELKPRNFGTKEAHKMSDLTGSNVSSKNSLVVSHKDSQLPNKNSLVSNDRLSAVTNIDKYMELYGDGENDLKTLNKIDQIAKRKYNELDDLLGQLDKQTPKVVKVVSQINVQETRHQVPAPQKSPEGNQVPSISKPLGYYQPSHSRTQRSPSPAVEPKSREQSPNPGIPDFEASKARKQIASKPNIMPPQDRSQNDRSRSPVDRDNSRSVSRNKDEVDEHNLSRSKSPQERGSNISSSSRKKIFDEAPKYRVDRDISPEEAVQRRPGAAKLGPQHSEPKRNEPVVEKKRTNQADVDVGGRGFSFGKAFEPENKLKAKASQAQKEPTPKKNPFKDEPRYEEDPEDDYEEEEEDPRYAAQRVRGGNNKGENNRSRDAGRPGNGQNQKSLQAEERRPQEKPQRRREEAKEEGNGRPKTPVRSSNISNNSSNSKGQRNSPHFNYRKTEEEDPKNESQSSIHSEKERIRNNQGKNKKGTKNLNASKQSGRTKRLEYEEEVSSSFNRFDFGFEPNTSNVQKWMGNKTSAKNLEMNFIPKKHAYAYETSFDESYENLKEKNKLLDQLMKEIDYDPNGRGGSLRYSGQRVSRPSYRQGNGGKQEETHEAPGFFHTLVSKFGCFGNKSDEKKVIYASKK